MLKFPQRQPRPHLQTSPGLSDRAGSPGVKMSVPLAKIALKTSVAAVLAYVVAQALHWEYPFYAVIAAIIVMGSTAGGTLNLSIQRIMGTIVGSIAGAIFSLLLGHTPWSLGISLFSAIFLTSVCKLNEAAKLVGYVSAIVILNHNQNPWIYAWGRFLETALGIAAALLVSHLLFPAHAGTELRRCLSGILLDLEQFYQLVVDGALTQSYDRTTADTLKTQIISSFQKNRTLRKETKQGQAGEPLETVIGETWDFLIHRIWEHILTMEHTILARKENELWQTLSPQLTQLAQATSSAMLELATAVKVRQRHALLPSLDPALVGAIEQFDLLQRTSDGSASNHELLRFITFLYTMEEVGRKLQRMADTL